MIGDLVPYLGLWEPYYQHRVWLITGSRSQPGIPKVLESLGDGGTTNRMGPEASSKTIQKVRG